MSNLDEALERFALGDLEYGGGLANHGPMAAEALESLGHAALIPALLDVYAPRLAPAEKGSPLSESEAESALGRIERRADWVATFEARLAEGDWRAVVAGVLPDRLPGLFAGAGHGLLRTAHAVRALERQDDPLRRGELARGLAYWSARYQSLPGLPGSLSPQPGGSLEGFFAELPCLESAPARDELFFVAARRLEGLPSFARAIDRMPRPEAGRVESFLVTAARLGAGLYRAHPEARIAYVHAVTLPVGLLDLLPHLDEEQQVVAALFAVQAVAALHALHGARGEAVPADDEVASTAESWDEIRYRAACSIQEHAIKMVDACLRLDRLAPDPIHRLVAADAALRLEGSRFAAC